MDDALSDCDAGWAGNDDDDALPGKNGQAFRNSISLPTAKRQSCCVLNPEESPFLRRWDIATASCLMFVCFVSPYEVAFHTQDSQPDLLFWINRCVDGIFMADIVIQFFVMFPVATSFGTMYIGEHQLIARRYLRTWFSIDVVSVLPFDIVGVCVRSETLSRLSVLRVVRLLRLLKLAQLVRGMRIVKRYELEVGFSYRRMTLMKLFVVVVIASHWYACFLGIMSALQGDFCVGANVPAGCVETWLTPEAMAMESTGMPIAAWRVYMVALHEAATLIVHPHSAKPSGDFERIMFILMMFLGGFIWTRVISETTAITTSMNRHGNAFHSLMDDLNASCSELKLPQVVRRRLRAFFMKSAKESQHQSWKQITARMSPLLQAEVVYHTNRAWLQRVPYLKRMPKLFASRITMCLQTSCFAAQEVFGDVYTLYILHNGVCSKAAGRMAILTRGSVWGEEHLLLTAYWLLQANTAYTLTYAQVLALRRNEFQEVVDEFPEVRAKMRKFLVRYVFVRGVIYESKRRTGYHLHHRCSTQQLGIAVNMKSEATPDAKSEASREMLELHENVVQRRRSQLELARKMKEMGCVDVHMRAGVPIPLPKAELKRTVTKLSVIEDSFAQLPRSPICSQGVAPLREPFTERKDTERSALEAPSNNVTRGELRLMEGRIMEVLKAHHDETRSTHANLVRSLEHLHQRVGMLEGTFMQHHHQGPPSVSMPRQIPGMPSSSASLPKLNDSPSHVATNEHAANCGLLTGVGTPSYEKREN